MLPQGADEVCWSYLVSFIGRGGDEGSYFVSEVGRNLVGDLEEGMIEFKTSASFASPAERPNFTYERT